MHELALTPRARGSSRHLQKASRLAFRRPWSPQASGRAIARKALSLQLRPGPDADLIMAIRESVRENPKEDLQSFQQNFQSSKQNLWTLSRDFKAQTKDQKAFQHASRSLRHVQEALLRQRLADSAKEGTVQPTLCQ